MSILAIEIPLPDSVAVGAWTVGQRHPLKHRRLVLGGRAAEQRGALLLGAHVGKHDCRPKAETQERLVDMFVTYTLNDCHVKWC